MRRILLAGWLPFALFAADGQPPAGAAITIYSAADPAAFDPQAAWRAARNPYNQQPLPGFAVVRETRILDLRAGENRIEVVDVAAAIDPATVDLVDPADPGAVQVLEQHFRFDLATTDTLLERFLGRTIDVPDPTAAEPDRRIQGTLLSKDNGTFVLRTAQGLRILAAGTHDFRFGEAPGGLVTRPTLRWLVNADAAGRRTLRTAYQTGGITWRADYRLVLASDGTTADFGAWITILNTSGAGWKHAALTLMAGDVQPAADNHGRFALLTAGGAGHPGFTEPAVGAYRVYALDRRTDLIEDGIQQIALFPTVPGVTAAKRLVYDGAIIDPQWSAQAEAITDRDFAVKSQPRVDVHVRVENTEANHLGLALPRGKLRLYQAEAGEGALTFLGEGVIDHTPIGQRLQIRIGSAADVTGERKQVEFQVDEERRTISERFVITLRNTQPEPVAATVREYFFRWSTWQVVQQSDKFEKQDARTGHFEVEVPATGEKQIEYEVRYSW